MALAHVQCVCVHAAAQPRGVQGGQATGVFANETGRSGWTQLLDSVDVHPPLAHRLPAGPTPQTHPPAHPPAIMQSQAADQQPAPHMAVQDPVQQAVPAAAPDQHALAVEGDRQDATDFHYDSFSDSLEDEQMPEAAPQAPERHDQTVSGLPPMHAASDRASGQGQGNDPGDSASPTAASDEGEQKQQRDLQQQPQQEQQPNVEQEVQNDDRPEVIPQTDGAGDVDGIDTQDAAARHAPSQLQSLHELNANSKDPRSSAPPQPVHLQSAAGQGKAEQHNRQVGLVTQDTAGVVAQQQSQPGLPNIAAAAMPVQPGRRRRSRHVVQHAVRLAAAARDAMKSVATLEGASIRGQQAQQAALQSEPQLPSWLQPRPHAAGRFMQSEPQLPQVWDRPGRGSEPGQVPDVLPSSAVQQGPVGHTAQADSQYGGLGRPGTVLSHQRPSQSTVAAAHGSAPFAQSQVIPDSRATSDLQWQQQQQQWQQHGTAFPMALHSQRIESQVVSDSRATSDLRWAQHAQHGHAQQRGFRQQLDPSQHQPQGQQLPPDHADELVWEQAQQLPAMPETSEAHSGADDFEIVVSDSQPSPPQHADKPGGTPRPATAAFQHVKDAATAAATSVPNGQTLEQQFPMVLSPANAVVPNAASSRLERKADLQMHDVNAAAAAVLGSDQVDVQVGNPPQTQQGSATAATQNPASTAHMPDQATEGMPSFSSVHMLAGSHLDDEALDPILVPHAHAHIQAHEGTPSLAVVRDTPQSAAVATPWSHVRDTPGSEALQRVLPSPGLWLGLDQPSASKPPSVPLQSRAHTTSNALQLPHQLAFSGADQLQPGRACQEQLDATPTAPELTLRLSLSDGSSTKSDKAGPHRNAQHAHQQASPTHALLQARQLPTLPVNTALAHSTVCAQTWPPLAAILPQQAYPASQPAVNPERESNTNADEPQQDGPTTTEPCVQAPPQTDAAKSGNNKVPAMAAAMAAATAVADSFHPANAASETSTKGGTAQGSPPGDMQEASEASAGRHSHGHAQADPKADAGQTARTEVFGGEAAGHADLPSADQDSDQQHGDEHASMHPADSDHAEADKETGNDTASDVASSDDQASDDPDPDSSPASSASHELVSHRFKKRAPTQVTSALIVTCTQQPTS